MNDKAKEDNNKKRGQGSHARRNKQAHAAGTDSDNNEDHLCALEHRDFESGCDGNFVPSPPTLPELAQRFRLPGIDRALVMKFLEER